jgi:hypothetical protein
MFWRLLIMLVIVSACSRRISPTQGNGLNLSQKAQLLADKDWREVRIDLEEYYTDTLKSNLIHQFAAADLDDLYHFASDGTYRFDEGSTKHRPELKQVFYEGRWTFYEATSELHLESQGSTTIYHVMELSANRLVLKLPVEQKNRKYAYHLEFAANE